MIRGDDRAGPGAGRIRSTTVLAVRKGGAVCLAADGQVSQGSQILKHNARKVRRLGDGHVLAGFAGSTADAMSLFDKFEARLRDAGGVLPRAAVELAKEWRTDRALRRLEALLLVCDLDRTFVLSGAGDVIEPEDGVAAVGSGGAFAVAAARALVRHAPAMAARPIAEAAMGIASELCVYTNDRLTLEELAP